MEAMLGRYTPRQWFIGLLSLAGLLLALDLLLHFAAPELARSGLGRLFNITLEANVPTLYSSLLAVLAGLTAWSIGKALAWRLMAAFFIFLGIDDLFTLHEQLGTLAGDMARAGSEGDWVLFDWLRGFRSYYWHVVAAPLFIAVGVAMFLYLWRGFDQRRSFFIFSAGLACYAFAMLLDFLDGDVENYRWVMENTAFSFQGARHLARAVEEFIEMLGTSLIFVAFLRQWRAQR